MLRHVLEQMVTNRVVSSTVGQDQYHARKAGKGPSKNCCLISDLQGGEQLTPGSPHSEVAKLARSWQDLNPGPMGRFSHTVHQIKSGYMGQGGWP